MTGVISVKNLKKTYVLNKSKSGQKTLEALKGVSFEVSRGEIFGILGPNGAGKTTTLEIIEGLKNQTAGSVTVLGFDNLAKRDEIKKRIGVQLQSSEYLPLLTLGELLDLFASLYGRRADRGKLLALVGLRDKEHQRVQSLSGGQKQRFTIATSLVNQPEVMFLDEPTTGLDPSARRRLWGLIKKINQQGITIVITTHYMEEAEFLCNRVAIMDKGQILSLNEPKKLIDNLSQTTQISFLVDETLPAEIFGQLPEIKKIYSHYPKVILEISSLESINKIVQLLKNKGVTFSGFTVKTASLEDVYLDLTGHEFETENGKA